MDTFSRSSSQRGAGSDLDRHLRRWCGRFSLAEDDARALASLHWTRKNYGRDSYLLREGEPTSVCTLLLQGFVCRQKLVSSGARQIVAFHLPDEFVDLENCLLRAADHNLQTIGPCSVATVAKDELLDLMDERPAVRRAAWCESLRDSSIFREWVVNVGRRDSRARIAHLLCELVFRLKAIGEGRDGRFDFPITQEQLADATGLTPVHTNRTLQALRKDGLIQLGARALTVLDWDALKRTADFDELYLHQHIPHAPASVGA